MSKKAQLLGELVGGVVREGGQRLRPDRDTARLERAWDAAGRC